ncbi:MAG: SH3 domain-containing protein [Chloroflexus sp.]
MQTILSQISPTIAIVLIVIGLSIIALVVIIYRRQAANKQPTLPEIPPATSIDYTAIPLEEPLSLQDRLKNLSLAAKILLLLLPILLCVGIGILTLNFSNDQSAAPPTPTPSPVPVTIEIEDATVVRSEPLTIGVRVRTTGLADNTELQVELRADGQPLRWFDPSQTIRIQNDRGDLRAVKVPDGDLTPNGPRYTVVVSLPNGRLSDEAELVIPERFAAGFFGAAPSPTSTPSTIFVSLAIEEATVVRSEPLTIGVRVRTTGLADNTELQVELRADGQPLRWFGPSQTIRIQNDRGDLLAIKVPDGDPTPDGPRYTVVVSLPDGSLSDEAELVIPEQFAAEFFGQVVEAPPSTAPSEPRTPTPAFPDATPMPTSSTGPTVAVTNGGNVRKLPFVGVNNVIGGVNAGEQVQILGRTPNARWFYVRTIRDEIGWVSGTLLAITDSIIAEAPVKSVVTVFVSGTVYLAPDPASAAIARVEVNEVVELRERTADGTWYRVLNVRDEEGWVQARLLGIPDDVAAQVPVAR